MSFGNSGPGMWESGWKYARDIDLANREAIDKSENHVKGLVVALYMTVSMNAIVVDEDGSQLWIFGRKRIKIGRLYAYRSRS